MKDTQYLIQKSSGDLAQFSEEKLLKSLLNSGATEEQAVLVLNEVKKHLTNGCLE